MAEATTQPGAQVQTPADQEKLQREARQAERERMNGILGCDEAKKRQKMAQHLAMKTDMSVDDAKGLLAVAPEEGEPAAAKPNAFQAAMDNGKHPNVGADGSGGEDDNTERTAAQRILASQSLATGQKFDVKH